MIYRGKIGDIIFEFTPAEGKAKGAIIICDGLPSVPKQKELMAELSGRGFFVIYPRYKGTWESSGQFLRQSPARDIKAIIQTLKRGFCVELYSGKSIPVGTAKINLLGSSFGASVALALANETAVNKIVALSPIIDFLRHDHTKEQNLNWLDSFLKRAFNQVYRYEKADWQKMLRGKLFNPPQQITAIRRTKILAVCDAQDKEIEASKTITYATANKIKLIQTDGLGHISFSKLKGALLDDILTWLK